MLESIELPESLSPSPTSNSLVSKKQLPRVVMEDLDTKTTGVADDFDVELPAQTPTIEEEENMPDFKSCCCGCERLYLWMESQKWFRHEIESNRSTQSGSKKLHAHVTAYFLDQITLDKHKN